MDRNIHLRLYGTIPHGPEDDLSWQLYQSEALSRLRDISLSSTPPRFAPHGMAASRFEHSVGVGYLARKLCDKRSSLTEHRDLLIAASLCHDIGSPPFSHISELFFWDLAGRTHEEQTERLLAPGSELGQLLSGFQVDPARVVEIITGRDQVLGPLISGSIDLDNIDNSLHLLVSLGYEPERPYHPMDLIKAYRIRNEKVSLDTLYLAEILSWAATRRQLYDVLHSEPNLSSATMLYRALEFAYSNGRLDEEFFHLDESDALYTLRRRCGRYPRLIVERALRWQQYPLLHQRLSSSGERRLLPLYSDWRARKEFTDEIAARLNIDVADFALYVGQDRGEKAIRLPWSGEHSEILEQLFTNRAGPQRLAVIAHKDHLRLRDTKKVERIIDQVISELPVPDAGFETGHVFF